VVVSVILNELFIKSGSHLTIVPDHLVSIKAAGSFDEFISFFTVPDLSGFTNQKVIVAGIMIAIIASLETLLCIEAVDNQDPERNVTNTNRELIAQGIGNTISGLIGGLPITSVIVRSSANIQSGAKTKLSTLIHGVLLLVCVVAIPSILNKIPLSALAAILLMTGYKLAKLSVFSDMYKNGKYQFIPFMVTVGVIIGIDLFGVYKPLKGEGLLIGVVCGLIAAMVSVLIGNFKNSYYFHQEDYDKGEVITIQLAEEVSFLNRAAIKQTLDHLPENSKVVLDASKTKYIDFDVIEIIKEFIKIKAPLKKIDFKAINFKEEYKINNRSFVESH
jgi:MFS superfamily sulfate permease-like transporter